MGWLSGWNYRKSHTINQTTGAGEDYQVKIIVYYGSGTDDDNEVYCGNKCKADFGDIRFTEDDGTTPLDYWIENEPTAESDGYAVCWVEISGDLDADDVDIYIYYDNSEAIYTDDFSDIQHGENTFLFFDNFEGSLDGSKWNVPVGAISTSDGNLVLAGTSGTRGVVRSLTSFSENIALHVRSYASDNNPRVTHWCSLTADYTSNDNVIDTYALYDGANAMRLRVTDEGSETTDTFTVSDLTSEHVFHLTWVSGETKFYQDDNLIKSFDTNVPSADLYVFFNEGSADGDSVYVDWVFVRKWISSEPEHGDWGTETPAGGGEPPAGDGEFSNVVINDGSTGNDPECGRLTFEEDSQSAFWMLTKRGSAYSEPDNLVFSYWDGSNWHQLIDLDPNDDYIKLNKGKLQLSDVNLYRSATDTLSLASGDKMVFSNLVKINTVMPLLEVDPETGTDEVKDMLFDDDFNDPNTNEGVTGILTFQDTGETSHYPGLFGITFGGEVANAPALCTTHHLVVRKDFTARGILKSYEGIVSLHGGYAGWAPSENPFIWLAEGGDYGDKETLEIRIVTDKDENEWGYGDLRCRNVYTDNAVFANGWRLTEDHEESGILLIRPDGSIAQKWR